MHRATAIAFASLEMAIADPDNPLFVDHPAWKPQPDAPGPDHPPAILATLRGMLIEHRVHAWTLASRISELGALRSIAAGKGVFAAEAREHLIVYDGEQGFGLDGGRCVVLAELAEAKQGRPPAAAVVDASTARVAGIFRWAGLEGERLAEAVHAFLEIAEYPQAPPAIASLCPRISRAKRKAEAQRQQSASNEAQRATWENESDRCILDMHQKLCENIRTVNQDTSSVRNSPDTVARDKAMKHGFVGLLRFPIPWPIDVPVKMEASEASVQEAIEECIAGEFSALNAVLPLLARSCTGTEAVHALVLLVTWFPVACELVRSYEAEYPGWRKIQRENGPLAERASIVIAEYRRWRLGFPWCGKTVRLADAYTKARRLPRKPGYTKAFSGICALLVADHLFHSGVKVSEAWEAVAEVLDSARKAASSLNGFGDAVRPMDSESIRGEYFRTGIQILDALDIFVPHHLRTRE